MKHPIVYIAGKITDVDPAQVAINIAVAARYTLLLWRQGYNVYCPHLATDFPGNSEFSWERYLRLDTEILKKVCVAVFMIPENWRTSKGARREHRLAKRLGKPIFYSLEDAVRWLRR